jgi:hypothetical protein
MKTLSIMPAGHGHHRITTEHRGKQITAVCTITPWVDDYNSDNERKSKAAAKKLRAFVIEENKK